MTHQPPPLRLFFPCIRFHSYTSINIRIRVVVCTPHYTRPWRIWRVATSAIWLDCTRLASHGFYSVDAGYILVNVFRRFRCRPLKSGVISDFLWALNIFHLCLRGDRVSPITSSMHSEQLEKYRLINQSGSLYRRNLNFLEKIRYFNKQNIIVYY